MSENSHPQNAKFSIKDDGERLMNLLKSTAGFSLHFIISKPKVSIQKTIIPLSRHLQKRLFWMNLAEQNLSLSRVLTGMDPPGMDTIVVITGIEDYIQANPEADPANELETLNRRFFTLRQRFTFPLLLHIPPYMIELIQEFAPDMWQGRNGIYVLDMPSTERFQVTTYLQDYFLETDLLINHIQRREWLTVYSAMQWESGYQNIKKQTAFESKLFGKIGRLLYQVGKFREALDYFRKQKEYALIQKDKALLPEALNNTGVVYEALGNPQMALETLHQANEVAETNLRGTNHPYKAIILSNLSSAYLTLGNLEEGFLKSRQALRMFERKMGMRHYGLVPLLIKYGKAQLRKGIFGEALDSFRRALQIIEKEWEFDHPYMAVVLQHIGLVYLKQGKADSARRYFYRNMERVEKVLGPEHPYMAEQLNQIGFIHLQLENYKHALQYFQWALQIRQQNPGGTDPLIGEIFRNIASVYQRLRKYRQAQNHFQSALRIFRSSLSENHPAIHDVEDHLQLIDEEITSGD